MPTVRIQWKGTDASWQAISVLMALSEDVIFRNDDGTLSVHRADGTTIVRPGDWINIDSLLEATKERPDG